MPAIMSPRLRIAAFLSPGIAAATILRLFPPEHFSFYPPCPFHALTGLLCPGCGATRALAALTHGDFAAAFHLNALVVTLLPVLVIYGFFRPSLTPPRVPNAVPYTVLAATAAFTVARNLP